MNRHENEFSRQIRWALDENLDNISSKSRERLASARKIALSRKKQPAVSLFPALRPVFGINPGGYHFGEWAASRLWLTASLASLFIGLTMIYDVSLQQHINDLAEIDAMVLTDDLPLTAYVDEGFNSFLDLREEE